jgi:enoyl-CoA hydratase/carnithine racemase
MGALTAPTEDRVWKYDRLELRVTSPIAVVTLINPPSNALSYSMLSDLERAFDILDGDDIRTVVVTGAGDTFSVGADFGEILLHTAAETKLAIRRAQRCLDLIESFRKPVIAAINGYCLGGGLELALVCHLRIASTQAKLGCPEVSLGLVPGLGATRRLPLVVGRTRANEMLLTGHHVKAASAVQMGLVNAAVRPNEVLSVAEAIARRIAAKSPAAVEALIRCIRMGSRTGRGSGERMERTSFVRLSQSPPVRRTLAMLAGTG